MLAAMDEMQAKHGCTRRKMVANLPYVVATPVVCNALIAGLGITMYVVMVQWEIAERLTAKVGSHEYSSLAVLVQSVADVEIITDQPGSRLLNIYGRTFGTTSLTIWDQNNRSVSFLVRVSFDTKDLESRIRQAFPGAEIRGRRHQPPPKMMLPEPVDDHAGGQRIVGRHQPPCQRQPPP